jgi:hypothetical protein
MQKTGLADVAPTHEGWLEAHRYINMDLLAEQKKELLRQAA